MRLSGLYKTLLCGSILVAALAVAMPQRGEAQSNDVLNRLDRLENELDTLNRAVYRGDRSATAAIRGNASGEANTADTEVRLQQMDNEIRNLRGTIEEQGFQIKKLTEKLELMNADMQLRDGGSANSAASPVTSQEPVYIAPEEPSRNLTQNLAAEKPPLSGAYTQDQLNNISDGDNDRPASAKQLGTLTQDSSGELGASSGSVAAQYENAFASLKNGNVEMAEREFQKFLNEHPDHELTPNAQYWLGETYYVRGNYERAARLFAEGYQKYPKSPKAADNLLKLGMSLAGMDNKADACVALSQLKGSEFKSAANVQRRAEQEMSRLGC